MATPTARPQVVLGVGGGIAAYKVCSLLRALTESGHDVRVVPTQAALRFVGAATWEALSGQPVRTQVWDDVDQVAHVRLGQQADLVVVAPATADLLARAAHGLADDLLTNVLLTARCPVLMAPAMHTEMWQHPATRANVATLRSRGVHVLDPAVGRLTGTDSGPGRLPEPDEILAAALALLPGEEFVPDPRRGDRDDPRGDHSVAGVGGAQDGHGHDIVGGDHAGTARADLAGRRVVISAGGTQEPLDPVRYLGNRSSGKQGVALAETALARGAQVTLVAANLAVPEPAGIGVVRVRTAEQLRAAMLTESKGADVVVMAAAVADFRPVTVAATKIKKAADSSAPGPVALERTADVLAELVAARTEGQVVVGFAAETGDGDGSVLEHGRSKLRAKGVDLLVVNDVTEGKAFGADDNEVVLLGADGSETAVPRTGKVAVAHAVWDRIAPQLT